MAEIMPFRGVRYAAGAGDLAALTAPPYDVILAEERERLERSSPHNFVRLILGRDQPGDDGGINKYTRAATLLGRWLDEGVLVADPAERLYVYEQRATAFGADIVQRGVLAAVSLDEASILPHERTMARPVEDRLALMRATAANLEPIICFYEGEEDAGRDAVRQVVAGEPLTAFDTSDGVAHRLWGLDDSGSISAIAGALAGRRLIVADGHHRLRTAQEYRTERRAADGPGPWDALLVLVVDAGWSGPAVLPIHRVLSGVKVEAVLARMARTFAVDKAPTRSTAELERTLSEMRAGAPCFVVLDRRRAWFARLNDPATAAAAMPPERSETWRSLDVSLLHAFVFERLLDGLLGEVPGFVHSAAEADNALRRGEASVAFLLAPTPPAAVARIAEEGEAMPPKSTYFFPKPRSGAVMRLLR